mmetsp:Transcript_11059/g.27111  ORF Transcript_11059/g.27111 Transcript_11059/m.27111 type:complete len:268 (-) Transcript_11059:1678-2481(-)
MSLFTDAQNQSKHYHYGENRKITTMRGEEVGKPRACAIQPRQRPCNRRDHKAIRRTTEYVTLNNPNSASSYRVQYSKHCKATMGTSEQGRHALDSCSPAPKRSVQPCSQAAKLLGSCWSMPALHFKTLTLRSLEAQYTSFSWTCMRTISEGRRISWTQRLMVSSTAETYLALMFHTRRVLSADVLNSHDPSTAREVTASGCPCSDATSFHVRVSHTQILPSLCPVYSRPLHLKVKRPPGASSGPELTASARTLLSQEAESEACFSPF